MPRLWGLASAIMATSASVGQSATLTMQGESSITMNGARLQATCTRTATVLFTNTSAAVQQSYPTNGVRAFLGGMSLLVALT